MSGNNNSLTLDDIKERTTDELNKLIKGELFMSSGLEERDIFRLVPSWANGIGNRIRLSKHFVRFCNSLLTTILQDRNIFSLENEKRRKDFLRNAIISRQSYIMDVIKDFMRKKDYQYKRRSSSSELSNGRNDESISTNRTDDYDSISSISGMNLGNDSETSDGSESNDEIGSHIDSDEEILDFNSNPMLNMARERFELEKKKILNKIPIDVRNDFRKIGFARWGKDMLPIIQLSPFDVEPGSVRESWLQMFKSSLNTNKVPNRLIMWYGTVWENRSEAFSFLVKSKITTYESGKTKGYDKLTKTLHKKIVDGKLLTEKERFKIQGLDQMKNDIELPLEKRIQWMSRFAENYDAYFYLEGEDNQFLESPKKTEQVYTTKKLPPKQPSQQIKKPKSKAKQKQAGNKVQKSAANKSNGKRKASQDRIVTEKEHKRLKQYLDPMKDSKKKNKSENKATHIYAPRTKSETVITSNDYEFSEDKFLHSKHSLNSSSINPKVWKEITLQLSAKLEKSDNGYATQTLTVVDLNANIFSMLKLFMNGLSSKENEIQEMFHVANRKIGKDDTKSHGLIYYAYEPSQNLLPKYKNHLTTLGFKDFASLPPQQKINANESILSYQHDTKHVTVHLIMNDFRSGINKASNLIKVHGNQPDLIVGCCFADLFPIPKELIASIIEISNPSMDNTKNPSTLLYFPITFGGTTLLNPPQPFGHSNDKTDSKIIPSDTFALRTYADNLTKTFQHNLDTKSIIRAAEYFGMKLMSSGPSNWYIDPSKHSYLWETMRFFFKTVIGNENEWNMSAWFDRMHNTRPSIIAKNVDLLFQFDSERNQMNAESKGPLSLTENSSTKELEEIEFFAPYKVRSVKKPTVKSLAPNEIEIQSLCSLISSGTELKIFRGTFDNSEPLDVNIKGMSDTSMAYPLSYGYSLVGKVIRCGSSDNEHLIGKHVFTFSPHSSRVVCDLDSIHVVPNGISPEDAIFLPSVETALSIIHDAHIRLGERVAVFGQGLIGLLVTSILSMNKHEMKTDSHGLLFDTVTAFDTIMDRLAAASAVGASEALLPQSAIHAGPFDVTIEVSGNGRALQSAIDCTRDHGRIVIGSWYGNSDVPLSLGMDFHRSHKTLVATQVSEIPPALRGLWSKERRFNLSWELVRRLKPSQKLVTRWEELGNAQKAYDALDTGEELCVGFSYCHPDI